MGRDHDLGRISPLELDADDWIRAADKAHRAKDAGRHVTAVAERGSARILQRPTAVAGAA